MFLTLNKPMTNASCPRNEDGSALRAFMVLRVRATRDINLKHVRTTREDDKKWVRYACTPHQSPIKNNDTFQTSITHFKEIANLKCCRYGTKVSYIFSTAEM